MLYTVKTVVGRENIVLESIASKANSKSLLIQSLVHPEEIKGYIFVEGDIKDIEKAVQLVPHVRGIIKTPIELNEIKRFLKPKTVEIELNEGDMVEVIGGPFKGEKGKVTRFDVIKSEVTMELIEVTVPIPITVNAGLVKVIKRAE